MAVPGQLHDRYAADGGFREQPPSERGEQLIDSRHRDLKIRVDEPVVGNVVEGGVASVGKEHIDDGRGRGGTHHVRGCAESDGPGDGYQDRTDGSLTRASVNARIDDRGAPRAGRYRPPRASAPLTCPSRMAQFATNYPFRPGVFGIGDAEHQHNKRRH